MAHGNANSPVPLRRSQKWQLAQAQGGRCRDKSARRRSRAGPSQRLARPCVSSGTGKPSRGLSAFRGVHGSARSVGFGCTACDRRRSSAPRPSRCPANSSAPARHPQIQVCSVASRGLPSGIRVCHRLDALVGGRSKMSARGQGEAGLWGSGRCGRDTASCRLSCAGNQPFAKPGQRERKNLLEFTAVERRVGRPRRTGIIA